MVAIPQILLLCKLGLLQRGGNNDNDCFGEKSKLIFCT